MSPTTDQLRGSAAATSPDHGTSEGEVSLDVMQRLADRDDISALVHGWMFRDLGHWDRLASLFHPDASIETSWFEGSFQDFLDASVRMASSPFRNKHLISTPVTDIVGDRAFAETNIVVLSENGDLGLGCTSHARFMDRVERRDGSWKILKRVVSYDMATLTFPFGIVEIDTGAMRAHPREYAALGYLLEHSGYRVLRPMPTRGSAAENEIRTTAMSWLHETDDPAAGTTRRPRDALAGSPDESGQGPYQ